MRALMNRSSWHVRLIVVGCVFVAALGAPGIAADEPIPHAQDKPPGPPLSPEEAVKKMTVPPGFRVEIVAAEPDLVNPIAMTFDERGRIWVTESIEYPRKSPGPGKDRVKILEDTDGDGRVDKVSTFLDGLNIPSGVAVGHGGVWIANSPDILFVPDADRDGKPDGPAQVVVTGFGRTDTHELPNSLTWGPDGWLYGLNGVFNFSEVKYPKSNPNYKEGHAGWKFTCAMFRIHPRTREFQIFAEGTSNPWGIAINENGDFFISACVIDHLWHIVETGYYIRQGGPYPPHTWPMGSIVKHKHQKAAYCGITWFDSDAYPEQYRRKLYMGNIHGGCINVDKLARDGSTYAASPEPDFLTANDAWFMPVAQKTGPDGCLYILDWYDRYHCYQDANRDPAGIERLKGRLYRVRYVGEKKTAAEESSPHAPHEESRARTTRPETIDVGRAPGSHHAERDGYFPGTYLPPTASSHGEKIATVSSSSERSEPAKPRHDAERRATLDLAKETDEQLIEKLGHPNVWMRETAQRLLQERPSETLTKELLRIAMDNSENRTKRCHAVFVLAGQPFALPIFGTLTPKKDRKSDLEPFLGVWSERILSNDRETIEGMGTRTRNRTGASANSMDLEVDPIVLRQVAITASKMGPSSFSMGIMMKCLRRGGEDPLIPRLVWQNIHPWIDEDPGLYLETVSRFEGMKFKAVRELMPRVADRILSRKNKDAEPIARLLKLVLATETRDAATARQCISALSTRIHSGEIAGDQLADVKNSVGPLIAPVLIGDSTDSLTFAASILATSWKDPAGVEGVRKVALSDKASSGDRLAGLDALIAAKDDKALSTAAVMLGPLPGNTVELRGQVLASLGRLEEPTVATVVVAAYPTMEPDLQPKAVELLTQRAVWAKTLLAAIGEKKLPPNALNENQVRKLLATKDAGLADAVRKQWGTVREGRNPLREQVIAEMKQFLRKTPGDPLKGREVHKKVCGQCHKMYGEGAEVGPDITLNGRNNYDQLLSNVFDPSLVIGASYQARILVTTDGRVLTGLPVEESDQRVVLKVQGGKLETVPRGNVEEYKVSPLSMMPENLEKTITPAELADLFAYITLDKPPEDKTARRLPGVYEVTPRASKNPAEFASILSEVAPGFTTEASGERGVSLLKTHQGRDAVVETHPPARGKPCVLKGEFDVAAGKKTWLVLSVSHDPRGDWQLRVKANGETLLDTPVGAKTTTNGWSDHRIDLSRFAGQRVKLELHNQPTDWAYEFGYWGRAAVVAE